VTIWFGCPVQSDSTPQYAFNNFSQLPLSLLPSAPVHSRLTISVGQSAWSGDGMHMMSKSTRAAAAAPNAMQRALSAAAAAKLPVPAFVRAAAYQVPFCPRLLPPGRGRASRLVADRGSCHVAPPRACPRPAPSTALCSSYFATPCTSY
jgi:hypothetical protein